MSDRFLPHIAALILVWIIALLPLILMSLARAGSV